LLVIPNSDNTGFVTAIWVGCDQQAPNAAAWTFRDQFHADMSGIVVSQASFTKVAFVEIQESFCIELIISTVKRSPARRISYAFCRAFATKVPCAAETQFPLYNRRSLENPAASKASVLVIP
jgi:hypothetical protein